MKCKENSLLLFGGTLASSGNLLDDDLRLVLLGNGQSLSVLGQLVEHVAALAAGVSVGVVSHVGAYTSEEHLLTSRALLAFNLELCDLAGVVDIEVLKDGLGSLLVLVADLLGLGVDLLLPLLLSTAQSQNQVDCRF